MLLEKRLVEVTDVPEAVEKLRPPALKAPARTKLPSELNRLAEEKN